MDFIVLSSARGTTFQAILDRLADGTLKARCLGLISDNEKHGCVEKAKHAGLPVHIVERKKGEPTEEYDKRAYEYIISFEAPPSGAPQDDMYIVCVGWMHILSPWFIEKYRNRILNIHPALLPKFGGKGMYGMKVHESVLNAQEKESGMTIHLVTEDVDAGPILIQKHCPVLPGDTPETLKIRVQELEKEWYPKVLQMIEEGTIQL